LTSLLSLHLRIEPRWLHLPGFGSGFRAVPPLADRYLETRDTRVPTLDYIYDPAAYDRYVALQSRFGVHETQSAAQ
jgi:hypothetical protein